MSDPVKLLAVADSDSYVKWGAALLSRAPAGWDRRLVVLASPVLPSADQLSAALATSGRSFARPAVIDLAALAVRVAKQQPDVVLLSVRGPLVKVVVRAIVGAAARRPVIVTGLPGISVPATRKAVAHRAQADLFVVHSRRELREFTALAETMRVPQQFALATLPFLPPPVPVRVPSPASSPGLAGDIIFAAQAKVPALKSERLALLGWLAESARRHPSIRVVIKVRATHGEQQTHAETHDYAALLPLLQQPAPANLVVEGGAMSAHLATAGGLVTVSSTAAVEAIALGRPVLILGDFGVDAEMINTVFIGSGLIGGSSDLIDGDFRHPDAAWLDDNFFHGQGCDDWVATVTELLEQRANDELPLKVLQRGTAGGRLRRAWDRKRALGRFDRSWTGMLALAIGMPLLMLLRARRKLLRRAAPADGELAVTSPEESSRPLGSSTR